MKGDNNRVGSTFSIITFIVSIVSGVSAFCAILAFMRNKRNEVKDEGKEDAWLRSDLDYLRRSMDNVALDLKDLRRQQTSTNESFIRLDERLHATDDKLHEIDVRVQKLESK